MEKAEQSAAEGEAVKAEGPTFRSDLAFEAEMPAFDPNRSDEENLARMEAWLERGRRAGLVEI